MRRRSSLITKESVADAFRRAALQLGFRPNEAVALNDATEIAQTATVRMTDDNRRRWTRVFLEPFLHNDAASIQNGLDLIAARERGDVARIRPSKDD